MKMKQQNKKCGEARKRLSVLTAAALLITSVSIPFNTRESKAEDTTTSSYEVSSPTTDDDGVTTWDCIYFGNYWQNDTNGDIFADQEDAKEPIKWRVLSVDGDDAFLLADRNLDSQKYNETNTNVTWETCTLRTWLNGTFLSNAFSDKEQAAIKATTVVNDDNPSYSTEGGENTEDKVYLLSIAEAGSTAYGLSGAFAEKSETREANNTAYAKESGAYTEKSADYKGNGCWWLRSSGFSSDYATYLGGDGWGYCDGDHVHTSGYAVRPVLHLNLSSSSVWRYAGKVTSKGEVISSSSVSPTATPAAVMANPTVTLNNPVIDDDGVTTWDCVYFGNYWQNDTNGDIFADQEDDKEPIKWRVLSVDGDDAFLLADRNLDCQQYNETITDVTWETCTLRTWLNETFLRDAFSDKEQAAIKATTVENDDNPSYATEGGEDTTDKVYLLSIAEAFNTAYGFSGTFTGKSKTREAKNTAYVKESEASTDESANYKGNGYWWLRSPGNHSNAAANVTNDGKGYHGYGVNNRRVAVRPALHVNLSHVNLSSPTVWRYAGKVTSEGEVILPPTATMTPTATPAVTPTVTPTVTSAAVTANPTVTLKNPVLDDDGVTTWDCVYFGNYWQNDTNGNTFADQEDDKEPIKWRVLSVDGDDAFLLADRTLDCQKYNEKKTAVTWAKSTLRTWLNGTFLQDAFSQEEQAAIKDTTVENDDNPSYATEGGEDTTDKVYLLSITEAFNTAYGFSGTFEENSKTREAKNTAYAKESGAGTDESADYEGNGSWWLRSPGNGSTCAARVDYYGWGYYYGSDVNYASLAVRPALHVNLSHVNLSSPTVWRYAGKVTSEGEVILPPTSTMTPTETPTGEQPAQSMAPTVTPTKTPTGEQPAQSMTPTVAPTETSSEEQPTQSTAPTETPAGEQPTQSMAPTDTLAATPTGEQSGQSMAPTGTSTVMPTGTPSADDTTKTVAVPSVKLKSLKVTGRSKNKAKVTWKKTEGISGYRLQYAQNKKFRKKLKTKLLDAKKTSVTLKGLKKKRTYYVRIRAYVLSDGKKVYGKWSTVKKIKIKK